MGFRDSVGRFGTDAKFAGVWLSDQPLDANEGAHGDALLIVNIALTKIRRFEWIEPGKGYREWLVPADIVNEFGVVKVAAKR